MFSNLEKVFDGMRLDSNDGIITQTNHMEGVNEIEDRLNEWYGAQLRNKTFFVGKLCFI